MARDESEKRLITTEGSLKFGVFSSSLGTVRSRQPGRNSVSAVPREPLQFRSGAELLHCANWRGSS